MRHRKAGLKLGRKTSHLNALFRNLVTSLFKHERIRTTDTKAKELRRWADHIVTLAKRGDLHARRQALAIVQEKAVVHSLSEKAGERFGKVSGGYTRLVKIGLRAGDAAPMTLIELVGAEEKSKKKTKKKPAAKAAAAKKKPAKKRAEKASAAPAAEAGARAETSAEAKP
jgi:large subunit ribosomal protein L17